MPSTCAAPPMSFFMNRMPFDGLMSRPPESKHTPLPISVTRGSVVVAPRQIDQARRVRARATDRVNRREILLQQIVADGDGAGCVELVARARCAASASCSGNRSEAGALIRSRTRPIASSWLRSSVCVTRARYDQTRGRALRRFVARVTIRTQSPAEHGEVGRRRQQRDGAISTGRQAVAAGRRSRTAGRRPTIASAAAGADASVGIHASVPASPRSPVAAIQSRTGFGCSAHQFA